MENQQQQQLKGMSISNFKKLFKQQQEKKDSGKQPKPQHNTFPNINSSSSIAKSTNNLDNLNLDSSTKTHTITTTTTTTSSKSNSLNSSPTFLLPDLLSYQNFSNSSNSSPRNSIHLHESLNSTGNRGSLKISNSGEFNDLFSLLRGISSPSSYHQILQSNINNNNSGNSGNRKTPPGNTLMNYLKNIQINNSGSATPRSRSTSIQQQQQQQHSLNNSNNINSIGSSTSTSTTGSMNNSPLPRSASVMNLKASINNLNAIELDYEFIIRRFLRSKSELVLPSWEMNEQYYAEDYNTAINETLVRTLSNTKIQLPKSSSDEELSQKSLTDSSNLNDGANSNNSNIPPAIFNENGDLLSGFPEKVIDHLTDITRFTGTQYVEEFLFTYHHFLKPIELLNKLKEKFENPLNFVTVNPNQSEKEIQQIITHVRLRVINVLKKWAEGHAHDFSDLNLYKLFCQFVDYLVIENPKWGKYLKELIQAPEFIIKNLKHTESSGSLVQNTSKGSLSAISQENKPQSMRELISLDNLGAISMLMFNSLVLKDRKKKLRTIKNSFLGNEAIDWLQNRFEIEKRDQAKQVLSRLLNSNYFKHHSDKNDDDDDSNSNSLNSSNGQDNSNEREFKDKSTIYYFHLEKDTYPEPIIPKSSSFTLLDVNPVEIARQLTLIEFNLFVKVIPRELSHQAWTKPDAKDKVPNLIALITRSNRVSYWVASEILNYNIKQRVSTLKRFIVIAEILKKLNNYNTFMAVMMGLSLGSIQRLKKTWEALPKNIFETFQQLLVFTSERQNFAAYRKQLSQCNYPCLPFLAIYLKDLTFTDENPDRLENGHINFEKMKMIARVLMEIDRYQSVPYHLKQIESIEKLLTPRSVLTDKDLYKISAQCEQTQRGLTDSSGLKLERKKSFFQLGSKK